MASGIDCDAATKSIILNSVAFARFANCEFDAALQVIDAILALPDDVPAVEIVPARALRGVIEICLGDYEPGRRHLREATEQARALPPSSMHTSRIFGAPWRRWACARLMTWLTTCARRCGALNRSATSAASSPRNGPMALCCCAREGRHVTRRSMCSNARRQASRRHKMLTFALATIGADLAIDAARRGKRDEAIDDLRASFSLHMSSGTRVFAGCPGEALVDASHRTRIHRRPRRGAPNRRPVAGPAARTFPRWTCGG